MAAQKAALESLDCTGVASNTVLMFGLGHEPHLYRTWMSAIYGGGT